MAAEEEPSETAAENATAEAAHQRTKPEGDHCEGQSHPAGLARLLPEKPAHGPEWSGRLAAATPAGAAAQTGERLRSRQSRSLPRRSLSFSGMADVFRFVEIDDLLGHIRGMVGHPFK